MGLFADPGLGFFFFFFFLGLGASPSPASPSALRFSPIWLGESVAIASAAPSAAPSIVGGAGGTNGVLTSATPPPSRRGGGTSTPTSTSCSHSLVFSFNLTCLVRPGTNGLDHASTSRKSHLRFAHASSKVSLSAV